MTVLQALDRYYDRMAARSEVAEPGFAPEPIGVVLVLGRDGTLLGVETRHDPNNPKKGLIRPVPKWFGRSGSGSTPFFLWDNTAYALGAGGDKSPDKTARDHAAFKALHAKELAGATEPGLVALRRFLAEHWTPDLFAPPLFSDKMLKLNVAFNLDGETRFVHDSDAARAIVGRLCGPSGGNGHLVQCLVTGDEAPPARLHPKIKGVDGTASAEVPLVSFNNASFESYGKEQGENAPTSALAASRYGAALNRLLARGDSRNRIKIADTTAAFWAEAGGARDPAEAEKAAAAAEDIVFSFLDERPRKDEEDDPGELARMRDALQKVAKGRAVQDLQLGLQPGTRFYVLGLAPNAARLAVRFWLDSSFEALATSLNRHFQDIAIEPSPWGASIPSVQRLLVKTTALMEKFDNIPSGLVGEVMRAVLGGTPYPRTLLVAAITRLRAGDDGGRGWHAAVIKGVLNRSGGETMPKGLNPDCDSDAYQLGRLFAVLEDAQRTALGRVNASIGDRFYGSASSTPARVFPTLLRGAQTHIADAERRDTGFWLKPKIEKIMLQLPQFFPATLSLEDQGRFAIGYYQERATRPPKKDADESPRPQAH